MDRSHQHHQSAAAGRCEACGMIAVGSFIDEHGISHAYCEHHRPAKGNEMRSTKHQIPNKSPIQNSKFKIPDSNHDRHAGHSANMFRDRFWLSLLVTIPTVVFSEMFQELLGYTFSVPGSRWIPLLGGTFLMAYGGTVFLRSAANELKARLPGMMTLISLAIIAAYGWSVAAFFISETSDFFWELATLITIMLLGHWLEMKAVADASGSLRELAKLLPDMAERLLGPNSEFRILNSEKRKASNYDAEKIPLRYVHKGDYLLIRPGAKIPVDGEVVEGSSSTNESMITGESKPVEKSVGSLLIAGTVNGHGVLVMQATRVGAETTLSGIMRLVAEAQASRSRAQVIADKAAFALTVVALAVGLITFIGWLAAGASLTFAIERLVTVLVIACPHALGLAVPLVTSISTTLAARNGILVRQRLALEAARAVDVVLFDKTGTLTSGAFGIIRIAAVTGRQDKDVLALAASLEAASEHPLAAAMVAKAQQVELKLMPVEAVKAIPGQGVTGKIGKKTVAVGGPQYLAVKQLTIPPVLSPLADKARERGETIVYIIEDEVVIGAITLADQIRPESIAAVQTLHQLGVKVAMVTGDAQGVAEAVAKELSIDAVFAEVSPEQKIAIVKQIQKGEIPDSRSASADASRDGFKIQVSKLKVAFVGDGVNDAAALTQADVGVAIGAGTDVAIESAGIVLMKNDPRAIVKIITLARATYRKTIENLLWATGYNVIAIPLAAGALASLGLLLSPAVGAIFMSFSTVIVAINTQSLRRVKLQ